MNKEKIKVGKKDSEGKINYEFDWSFIDEMAINMAKNKVKYEKDNWKKPMLKDDFESLEDSVFRHWRKYKQPIEGDVETKIEHLRAIACNVMMIYYQIKNNRMGE